MSRTPAERIATLEERTGPEGSIARELEDLRAEVVDLRGAVRALQAAYWRTTGALGVLSFLGSAFGAAVVRKLTGG